VGNRLLIQIPPSGRPVCPAIVLLTADRLPGTVDVDGDGPGRGAVRVGGGHLDAVGPGAAGSGRPGEGGGAVPVGGESHARWQGAFDGERRDRVAEGEEPDVTAMPDGEVRSGPGPCKGPCCASLAACSVVAPLPQTGGVVWWVKPGVGQF